MKRFHVTYSFDIEATKQVAHQTVIARLGSRLGSMIIEAEVYPNRESTSLTIKEYIEETHKVKNPNVVDWKAKDISIIFVREFTETEYEAFIA